MFQAYNVHLNEMELMYIDGNLNLRFPNPFLQRCTEESFIKQGNGRVLDEFSKVTYHGKSDYDSICGMVDAILPFEEDL